MTLEMQAVSGIADIGPLTFGELQHAAKAKTDFEWIKNSALMALIANCNRPKSKRPYKTEDFYRPQLYRRKRKGLSAERLHSLFGMFTKKA
jgi:hypothetical protein